MGNGLDAVVMDSAHGGPPSPQQTMMGDSIKGSPVASDEEGRINLPPGKRHGTGAQLALATTTPRPENPPTTQATMTTPSRQVMQRSDTDLPLERWGSCREDAQWWSKLASR
jgi:hypothetical protein